MNRVVPVLEQVKIARGFKKFKGSRREWARRNNVHHDTVARYLVKLENGHYDGVGEAVSSNVKV